MPLIHEQGRGNPQGRDQIDEQPCAGPAARPHPKKLLPLGLHTKRSRMTALLLGVGAGGVATLGILSLARPNRTGDAVRAHQEPVAVFGEENARATAERARRTAAVPAGPVPSQESREVPRELASTLHRCARSFSDAGCYAPVLESFHYQRSLPRAKAIEQKMRLLKLYPTIRKYEIRNLRLESLAQGRAVVTFDREWDIAGETSYAGAARHRVAAVRTSGAWQIVREEEQQVYWTSRQ